MDTATLVFRIRDVRTTGIRITAVVSALAIAAQRLLVAAVGGERSGSLCRWELLSLRSLLDLSWLRRFSARQEQRENADKLVARLQEDIAALSVPLQSILQSVQSIASQETIRQRALLALAQDQIISSDPRHRDQRNLSRVYGQVYSQNFEDGAIAEIFHRIGTSTRTFIEIGVGHGDENNTRLLLELGWSGVWFEADPDSIAAIRVYLSPHLRDTNLELVEGLVDRETIASQIQSYLAGAQPDFLSIDIDYNTSHIWAALSGLRPRAVCIEYNAHFPPNVDFEVPYDPDGRWQGTTHFGASLKALERIGRGMGYSLVGCDLMGVNAFFVREDLCSEDLFCAPFTAEHHYQPPRFSWVHMRGHSRHVSTLAAKPSGGT